MNHLTVLAGHADTNPDGSLLLGVAVVVIGLLAVYVLLKKMFGRK